MDKPSHSLLLQHQHYYCCCCIAVPQVMLDYPGGELKVVEGIQSKPKMRQPLPCCCLPRLRLDHAFVKRCKRMTLQVRATCQHYYKQQCASLLLL